MTPDFAIEQLAEDALLLRFGDGIDIGINARVQAAARALRASNLQGLIDIAPAYATLLVRFDPMLWLDVENARPLARIATWLRSLPFPALSPEQETARGRGLVMDAVEIPVCYGDEFGPDLEALAEHARLPRDEVIGRHTAVEYSVAMLGFAPGFPYLLGLDPALRMPRRAHPRTHVPTGSVAVGGAQTGIYPRELPGGWNLIGCTPLALFDPERNPPCRLAPGDRVRFRVIDVDEFTRVAERSG